MFRWKSLEAGLDNLAVYRLMETTTVVGVPGVTDGVDVGPSVPVSRLRS